ncbi:putative TPR repeat-containing protein [Gammaproteobacteria bacterium]
MIKKNVEIDEEETDDLEDDIPEPFEKKSKYYSHIDLGKDPGTLIYLIVKATEDLLISQAALSDRIVVSNERISDGLHYLSAHVDDVKEGAYGLKSAFEFGISEPVWQIEKSRRNLQNIIKISTFHLDEEGKKSRKQAEDYYAAGLIDNAEEECIYYSEVNEYDFTVYLNLGMIYMFRYIDLDESIYYFDNAAKYARQKSPYYASFALMHKARVLREHGSIDEARQCLEEAIGLSPDFLELSYQLSIIEAQSNKEKAVSLITKLLDSDIRYSLKAENEPAFNPIRADLHHSYKDIIDSQSIHIQQQHDDISLEADKVLEKIDACYLILETENPHPDIKSELNLVLQRLIELINRKSLIDSYTAGMILKNEATHSLEELKKSTYHYLDDLIKNHENEKNTIVSKYYKERKDNPLYILTEGGIGAAVYSIIYIATFITFRNLLVSVLLAAIPFVIAWSLKYNNYLQQQDSSKNITNKLDELVKIRDTLN